MFALRTISTSPVKIRLATVATRALSTQTVQAVDKLKSVLEAYRLAK
jgi:hypothetical protein